MLSIGPRLTLPFWTFSILQRRIWYVDCFHHLVTFAFLVIFHQYVSNQLHQGSTHPTIIFHQSESNQISSRSYQNDFDMYRVEGKFKSQRDGLHPSNPGIPDLYQQVFHRRYC